MKLFKRAFTFKQLQLYQHEKKLMKKVRKRLMWVFDGILIIYILILIFPQFLFANKLDYKNFSVYYHSDEVNIDRLKSILDESEKLLQNSELYKKDSHQKIFICNSFNEFTFFALAARKSYAVNYIITQNIFISKSSISENLTFQNGGENNPRTLSSIIAHETAHSLLENKLGTFSYFWLPTWKNEGYCELIANESSFSIAEGLNLICNDKKPNNSSFNYFEYRMITKELFEGKKISLEEFLNQDFDWEKLTADFKIKSCTQNNLNN